MSLLKVIKVFFSKGKGTVKAFLCRPKFPKNTNLREINCSSENITMISGSNVLLHIQTPEEDGYFCECRKHTSIKTYVRSFAEEYFRLYCIDGNSENDLSLIRQSLSNEDNFNRFIKMGETQRDGLSSYVKYANGASASIIGIMVDEKDKEQCDRVRKFICRYAWCQLQAYYLNRFTGKNKYQTWCMDKVMGTQEMAKLLSMEKFVPKSELVRLIIDGEEHIGHMMAASKGISIVGTTKEYRLSLLTPEFQIAMNRLNYLDVINNERDHSPNNYRVLLQNGKAIGVEAFDNNGIGTFSISRNVDFITYKFGSPLVMKGKLNRPFADKMTMECLSNLTYKEVEKTCGIYLRDIQVFCIWQRIKKVKKSLELANILQSDEWSENTIKEELSGCYGKTYLKAFIEDC